jgi:hypothetical protein
MSPVPSHFSKNGAEQERRAATNDRATGELTRDFVNNPGPSDASMKDGRTGPRIIVLFVPPALFIAMPPLVRRKSMTIIVAATLDNGIGVNGGLPWRLPGEMKWFARGKACDRGMDSAHS